MASKAPRFKRTIQRTPAPIDPLAGSAESQLAIELEGFAARRSAELDRRAAESGFLAGQQAAAEGEEATGSERTIRGRAFNRGVLASQQAAQQTDLRDSIERFELENETNPEAFDAKVEGLLEGLLEEADPRLQSFIRQRAADYAGRAKTRIIARQQTELLNQAAEDLKRGHQGMIDDATTAAFEGDILMIEARRQELNGLLGDAIDGGLIDEAEAIEVSDDFERQVTAQEVIGNFDRLVRAEGPDAGAEAIARWQEIKPSSVGLTAEDHQAVTRQLVTLRNREASLRSDNSAKEAAALRAETNLRQGRVQDAISVMRDGFPTEQDDAKQIAEDLIWLQSTGDADDIQRAQELAGDFDVANAIQGAVHEFRRMPAAARAEQLDQLEASMRSGGASAEERDLLKALKETSNDVNRQLDTDPRGYLHREGLVEEPALDFSGPAELISSLQARDSDIGEQLTGQPIGKFTAAEADQIAQVYEAAEIEERVSLLAVITAGTGDEAEATLEQLDSKGHQNMALLGGYVMEGRGLLARQIMRGQQRLAADPGIKPERPDYQDALDRVWGAAMGDWPEQRALILDAAFAKYADLKAATGDLSDIYQSKHMRDALESVMPTARFNGRRVAIPPGSTADAFDDWTDSWDVQTFTQPVGVTPDIEPLVSHGRANLATGADFTDKQGQHTILSGSVRDQRLNDGKPTVIPFVYDGRKVSLKEAIDRAVVSGIDFPSAETEAEATEISKAASAAMDQFVEGGTPMAVPGVTAEDMLDLVRDDGRLIELGNGRYGVGIVSAATGLDRFLEKDDGTPFILQFPQSKR